MTELGHNALSPDLALTFKSEGSPDSVNLIYVDMTLACSFVVVIGWKFRMNDSNAFMKMTLGVVANYHDSNEVTRELSILLKTPDCSSVLGLEVA